jgi:uncharacterized SAM-binding protein YcdF (DUF218 family)
MKVKFIIITFLFLIILIYIGACRRAGSWLIKEDSLVHSDALVLLVGERASRLLQVTDLYNKKLADILLVVETSREAYKQLEERGIQIKNSTDEIVEALLLLGIPGKDIVIIAGDADSTQDEARIIRDFVTDRPNIDTLLLVTSPYHTRRASIIFKTVFRKAGVKTHIACSPNNYSDFDGDKWWRNKQEIQLVIFEYIKLANFILFEQGE